ncbi:ABC transporter permease protein [Paenibacillus vortex V453]|uniref:ABC transporter permease protein n=2 Tax=Paenibacillus TaxID=44249 RepID=A0A2R9SQW3_9BACL|nr:ABC transporter permease protein [Paenibacillus vortex V453]
MKDQSLPITVGAAESSVSSRQGFRFAGRLRRESPAMLIGYGVMYLLAALWVIPLLWMVWAAFMPKSETLNGWSWNFTLENFAHVWQAAPFAQYYLNTLLIAGGVLAVQLVTVTLASFAFARLNFWGRDIIFVLFLVQLMIPADVLIFPNYHVIKELNLLDTKLGIMAPFFVSAFGVFLFRQMFKQLPAELEEAAVMEGCSKIGLLARIYVPLSIPVYVSFAVVSISHQWNNFLWPLIITNSVENRPLTVGLAIFAQSFETGAQWADVSAATLLVIAPLLVLFMIFQRRFINSFMHAGIK